MAADRGVLVRRLSVVAPPIRSPLIRPPLIGPVTPDQIEAVRAQLIETWHATYDGIYGAAKVRELTALWHSVAALTEQASRPDTVFLYADDGGRVVGSSYALRQGGDVVHLSRLYVAPRLQGQGVGQALMAATFAALPGASCQRLEVEPKNVRAITFYRRHGFVEAGRTSDCGGASGVPALILERRL
jgi:ribosomal protein S18 acetylase RimI-like enzyme